jgi:tetratricopeptide (TPR) repeat protein
VLSEEALILAAVAGACVLLVLGVLELVWPTRPRQARRARAEAASARPVVAVSPSHPAQSILPRRLIDSPSASRPAGGFVFPPPADYVPPPLPREEARPPVRRIGLVVPPPAETIDPPAAPPELEPVVLAYIPPPAVEAEPQPIELPPAPVEAEPLAPEPEPRPAEPEPLSPEPPAFEPVLLRLEPEPPQLEPEPLAPEPPRFEPVLLRLEPEPPQLEPEPPRFEPDPPRRFEPEPLIVETSSAVVEPEPVDLAPPTVEPPPSPLAPEPPPIAQVPPSLAPVAPPREQTEPPQPAEPAAPPLRRRRSKISPHARPHRVLRPAPPESPIADRSATSPMPPPATEAPAKPPLPTESASAGIDAKLTRDSPLVERCFALYQEKRFDEVLSVAEPALAGFGRGATAGPSREIAALWSVVGLAKQALGDDDGAHAALESSIDAAFDPERATYRRHLATHALEAAQARLARAAGHDPGDRMAVIRAAIEWADRGLSAVPADPALGDAREASHEALWQAYEQAATALLQRQEFPAARQILHEALDDPKLPAARAAGFRGLLSGTFGGEIGQLTAQAILSMQEGRESEALGVLQRAEELLAAIPADSLPPTRRDEVDQRLWWGYAELGSRRLDAGDYEEALDPLVHSLRFASIGPERQAETRAAVVRALEGIAAVRALSIRRLAEAGGRDEAIVAAGELHELVKRGLELGITEDELVAAFARVRRLCEELGMDARA